jgi:3-hydroxyacyl-CoA dehydrogenase
MALAIKRAAVLGAGVMGSGIAAHLANAGIPVLLLDVVPDGATDRDVLAKGAIERMKKADPSPFVTRAAAKRVTPGNLDDHLAQLADCDWIVEAVLEDLAVKHALYARLEAVRKPGTLITSNTSTIPLARLVEGRSDAFTADFAITHFFNPPRWMRLLEVVAGPTTRADAIETLRDIGDRLLGKSVVMCHDTPGFIANRIGTFWMQAAVQEAIDLGLTVEQADAVCGRPMGIPKTAIFGLMDLVGIDLMPHVGASLLANLPAGDRYRSYYRDLPLITQMIGQGLTGRKGKGGFYRVTKVDGAKTTEVFDLVTATYRAPKDGKLASVAAAKGGLGALVAHADIGGQYAWRVLSQTLVYACEVGAEIADSIADIDEAMRTGFNWERGPFEMLDQLGAANVVARLQKEGASVPPLLAGAAAAGGFYRIANGKRQVLAFTDGYADIVRAPGVDLLADRRLAAKPIAKNGAAALWDLGDGVLGIEFTSKMNALEPDSMTMLRAAIERIGLGEGPFSSLVIYNEGANFSVGANLGLMIFGLNLAAWKDMERLIIDGQQTYKALKYAPFPVVGAVHGLALGGGCEVLLHCDAIVAHVEASMGLVEAGVGLLPGWGGCKELLIRQLALVGDPSDPMLAIAKTFELIAKAQTAKNAFDARDLGFLRADDEIVMNRDRLLATAKAKAIALRENYRPTVLPEVRLPGVEAKAALDAVVGAMVEAGQASAHDAHVAGEIATVLTGGDTNPTRLMKDDDLFALERAAFLRLAKEPKTWARIEAMLATGKPLRN